MTFRMRVSQFLTPLGFPALLIVLTLVPVVFGGIPAEHRDAFLVATALVVMAAVVRTAILHGLRDMEQRWRDQWIAVQATGASFDAVASAIHSGLRRIEARLDLDETSRRELNRRVDDIDSRVRVLEEHPVLKMTRSK